jgi:ABC-type transport system involved in multi-copper enzyme maturation permease subunit
MNLRVLYHIARADFLERARRYSFLVTIAVTLYLAYQIAIGNVGMRLGNYRGVFNSPWLGMMLAMCTSIFVTLVGFYIIKNTIERDRHTGVGQILAATPLGRSSYMAGKAISNFLVLAVILAILAAAAIPMQIWQGEGSPLDLWQLYAPLLFLTLPAFAFLAALVLLFECIPGLRSGFGNVFYVFFWLALVGVGIKTKNLFCDLVGAGLLEKTLVAWAKARLPDYNGGFSLGAIGAVGQSSLDASKAFLWEGVHWSPEFILPRLLLFVYAAGIVLLAAGLFDRFDPSRGIFHRAAARLGVTTFRLRGRKVAVVAGPDASVVEARESAVAASSAHLTPLAGRQTSSRFGALLGAELRLMFKGRAKLWYLVAAGLVIGSFFAPAGEPRGKVLAFAWLWPVLLWSQMGTREERYATGPLIFSTPHALGRQLPTVWLAGVSVALLVGAGVGLRHLAARDWTHLAGWLVGAMFIPALALALGVWSGTSKLFEGLYTALWYIGPAQPTLPLDFIGASAHLSSRIPMYCLGTTVILLAAAVVGRRRQIRG